LKRVESITVRLAPGCTAGSYDRSRMRTQAAGIVARDNAAFGLEPQGYGLANRLAD
jgi:hypothetical protein